MATCSPPHLTTNRSTAVKLPDYSIVIATRNRPAALRLSIPRMLGQTPPPAQMVVVDSSDDHGATVAAVAGAVSGHSVDLTVLRCDRGLTRQRNAALAHLRHPVVFFPDDDSIWFPQVARTHLEVYQRDSARQIAAVCAAEAPAPPPGWEVAAAGSYRMRRSHLLQQRFARARARLENHLAPDPARLLGRSFFPPAAELPDWFGDYDAVPVEWMTGFRMSFRTEVIRAVGFDETLARYSLFEDIDASFAAWRHGWVVGARNARVFHYRSPERRDDGRRLGVEQLLNKAFVIAKHAPIDHPARAAMCAFGRYKTLQYRLAANGEFGAARLAGARAALREIDFLADSPPEVAAPAYLLALVRCLPESTPRPEPRMPAGGSR
jgi:glycosyltransferase involved in cell wall biosynthesis